MTAEVLECSRMCSGALQPRLARQGVSCRKGPSRFGKFRVLSAWTPALWSPLNRVTAPGHPAFTAATGELNHKPRWNVWIDSVAGFEATSGNGGWSCTTGASWPAGGCATMNVSMLKRPMNFCWPFPSWLVSMSPWYQDRPKGSASSHSIT